MIKLDTFIKQEDQEKKVKEEKEGIVIPFTKTFKNFIQYISRSDTYGDTLNITINKDELRASYMSGDRVWMAVMEMSIHNYANSEALFCIVPSEILPAILNKDKIIIDKTNMEHNYNYIVVNGEEIFVTVSECTSYPEPEIDDKLTEKIAIDIREFRKILKNHILKEENIYSLHFITLNNRLTLKWKNYYTDEFRKFKVSTFTARVLKSNNVISGYDPNTLKKLLNYPTSRIIMEYGAEVPMKITLENTIGRNIRVWLAPRMEDD